MYSFFSDGSWGFYPIPKGVFENSLLLTLCPPKVTGTEDVLRMYPVLLRFVIRECRKRPSHFAIRACFTRACEGQLGKGSVIREPELRGKHRREDGRGRLGVDIGRHGTAQPLVLVNTERPNCSLASPRGMHLDSAGQTPRGTLAVSLCL